LFIIFICFFVLFYFILFLFFILFYLINLFIIIYLLLFIFVIHFIYIFFHILLFYKIGKDFAHGKDTKFRRDLIEQERKWKNLVKIVAKINSLFTWSNSTSLYDISILNPLNIVPLRLVWYRDRKREREKEREIYSCSFIHFFSRLYGLESFWKFVVVPIYSSTFLTVELDALPTQILPIIDDMISPR